MADNDTPTMSRPPANHQDIERFLLMLHGAKPDELYCYSWSLPSKHTQWFTNSDSMIEAVTKAANSETIEALYSGVAWSTSDNGKSKRINANEAAGMPALWIDL